MQQTQYQWLGAILIVGLLGLGPQFAGAAKADDSEEVAAPQTAQNQTTSQDGYAERGADTCMKCHDEPPVTLILHTAHAQRADSRTPFAAHDCETCHGPSPEHMVKPAEGAKRAEPGIVFGAHSPTPAQEQNKSCLQCHQGGLRMNWQGSQHDRADLACASCHTIHTLHDPVLAKKTQPGVCINCHVTQRAQMFRFSHHPIREGKVVCSNCHNPHGSFGPTLLAKATINDTCYQCHAEKRGPFLWEHAPVRESCLNCHTPHGSTQARLLKIRAPFLCQTCHMAAFHPSTLYEGNDIPPFGADQHLLAKGCLNCHVTIHGSNHPSGIRFLR